MVSGLGEASEFDFFISFICRQQIAPGRLHLDQTLALSWSAPQDTTYEQVAEKMEQTTIEGSSKPKKEKGPKPEKQKKAGERQQEGGCGKHCSWHARSTLAGCGDPCSMHGRVTSMNHGMHAELIAAR